MAFVAAATFKTPTPPAIVAYRGGPMINLLVLLSVFILRNGGKLAFWLARGLLRLLVFIFRFMLARHSTSHGSARWAGMWSLWRADMWGGDGIVLGRYGGRIIRLNRDGYALVIAKSRSGKGVGLIVPSILDARGSVIVTDIKAENYDITQRDRQRLGPVYRLDLIEPESSDSFNPLDMVRMGSIHEPDDALALANLLIEEDPAGGSHWDNKARELLQALIIFVCRCYDQQRELRTLARVKSLTALGLEGLIDALEDVDRLGSPTLSAVVSGLRGADGSPEARSIVSNADKALLLFGRDRPSGLVTARSDFMMDQFKRGVATLYIIVEEDKLPIYGGFLRIVIGCALMGQTRDKAIVPDHRTLIILDEAAAIGRIPELETGAAYLAAYARLMFVFQDFAQLECTYPKARSIMANASALVAFGVRETETARRLSEMIGQKTTLSFSAGTSQASTAVLRHQASSGRSETGRALLDLSEILRLPPNEVIIFADGLRHPVRARKLQYYRERRYRGRHDQWRGFRAPRRRGLLALCGWARRHLNRRSRKLGVVTEP